MFEVNISRRRAKLSQATLSYESVFELNINHALK